MSADTASRGDGFDRVDGVERCHLIAELVAKPEHAQSLRLAILAMVDEVRREPGCIEYTMHVERDDPTRIVMYETWENEAALRAHAEAALFLALLARLEHWLARPLSLRLLRRLA